MKKRNKLDERPETEKCVRFNVEKNVLVEYLWGRPEEHRIQHAAPSETHEDEVPNHTQLLSSHFNNTFSPRHIRVKLADLLRVIEEERQHIRNRKFSISSDGTFKFKREKRRGFLHIMRDIKEIIACMRAYIAKHSSDTIVNKVAIRFYHIRMFIFTVRITGFNEYCSRPFLALCRNGKYSQTCNCYSFHEARLIMS